MASLFENVQNPTSYTNPSRRPLSHLSMLFYWEYQESPRGIDSLKIITRSHFPLTVDVKLYGMTDKQKISSALRIINFYFNLIRISGY